MPALAVRKSTWDAATDTQRRVFQIMGIYSLHAHDLRLGNPATLRDPSDVEHYVWEHPWWVVRHLSYLFCTFANIAEWPPGWTPTGHEGQDRETIMRWCEDPARGVPLVLPGAMSPVPDGTDPWMHYRDECSAPAYILMAAAVPDTWVVVEAAEA